MNIKNIIWEEIGKELEENSFVYIGWKNNSWTYEMNKEPGHILEIVKYRFGDNCISYNLIGKAGPSIVPAPVIDSLSKYNIGMNYYHYNNEEEIRLIVREFWREIKKRGWKDLDENYYNSKKNSLDQWHLKLYEEHEELYEKYIEKNNVVLTTLNEETVNRYFEDIDKLFDSYKEVNMDEVISVAAFLGQLLVDNMGARWVLRERNNSKYTTLIDNINAMHYVSINILGVLYQEIIGNICKGNLRERMISIVNDAKK